MGKGGQATCYSIVDNNTRLALALKEVKSGWRVAILWVGKVSSLSFKMCMYVAIWLYCGHGDVIAMNICS